MSIVIEQELQDHVSDESLYEIIDGQRVELPPMSAYATFLASKLISVLNQFGSSELGVAVAEMLFRLPLVKSRNRRPDGAYISYRRWAKGRPIPSDDNAWDVVPNLGIEVVSPSDGAEELLEKIQEFFEAGVELVWVVYPKQRLVHVFESMTRIRVLTHADELDGGTVLPGFRLRLGDLFQDEAKA